MNDEQKETNSWRCRQVRYNNGGKEYLGSVAAKIEYPEIQIYMAVGDYIWYGMACKIKYIPKLKKNRKEHI